MIRLVATDLDGTFWGAGLVPPAEHVAAVGELVRLGVTVLAATARRPRVAGQRLADAGLTLPAVLLDGAVGIDFRTGERFHQAVFALGAASETLAAFRAHGLDPCLYVDDPEIDVAVSPGPSTCPQHLEYLGDVAGTRDLTRVAAVTGVYGFSVLGLDHEVLAPLARDLAGTLGNTVVLRPDPDYGQFGLTVTPRGVSKWSGIEAYCLRHGIALAEVAAVGDGLNDVEMLRRAAVSIGVRGGCDEVAEISDFLIGPPEQAGWSMIAGILADLKLRLPSRRLAGRSLNNISRDRDLWPRS